MSYYLLHIILMLIGLLFSKSIKPEYVILAVEVFYQVCVCVHSALSITPDFSDIHLFFRHSMRTVVMENHQKV